MIYCSGKTISGHPLMAGIFAMKDQEGFPVDASFEECKQRGFKPDWVEYLADAGRQPQWKFDAAYEELVHLLGGSVASEMLRAFNSLGAAFARTGDDFIAVCERIWKWKRAK